MQSVLSFLCTARTSNQIGRPSGMPSKVNVLKDAVFQINSTSLPGVRAVGFSTVRVGSEEDLEAAVATVGPVAVGIDASKATFHFYSSGF